MMKNEYGQLQAKLNLNIEAEPAPAAAATATAAAVGGCAPTFVEKPRIVTKEEGRLIMLIVKYRAEAQCELIWSFKETRIIETKTIRIVHERIEDYFEARLELTVLVSSLCEDDPNQPLQYPHDNPPANTHPYK
jgi:hypothetical protein